MGSQFGQQTIADDLIENIVKYQLAKILNENIRNRFAKVLEPQISSNTNILKAIKDNFKENIPKDSVTKFHKKKTRKIENLPGSWNWDLKKINSLKAVEDIFKENIPKYLATKFRKKKITTRSRIEKGSASLGGGLEIGVPVAAIQGNTLLLDSELTPVRTLKSEGGRRWAGVRGGAGGGEMSGHMGGLVLVVLVVLLGALLGATAAGAVAGCPGCARPRPADSIR